MENKKGISLITLIITIVVIIILATITIINNYSTPNQAGYAKFCVDIEQVQDTVAVKTMQILKDKAINGEDTSPEEVYKEIVVDGSEQIFDGVLVKELDGDKLGYELPTYFDRDGSSHKWYVDPNTDTVYLLPGYEYNGTRYVTGTLTSVKEETDSNNGSVIISGSLLEGSLLTAVLSDSVSDDSLVTYSWWYTNDRNATSGVTIEGEVGSSYTIGDGLVGKYIGVTCVETRVDGTVSTFSDVTNRPVYLAELKIAVNKPVVSGVYTYNGEEQYVRLNGFDAETMFISGNIASNVGSYTAVVSLIDADKYEWSDGTTGNVSLDWEILAKNADGLTATVVGSNFNYAGDAIEPGVVIKDGKNVLTNDVDYSLSYSNNVEVGNAKIEIAFKGNYYGRKNISFSIVEKIDAVQMNGITVKGYEGEYDGFEHGIKITLSGTSTGATIKYGTAHGTYDLTESPTYTNVGNYTVYYQISKEGYMTVTGSETVIIKKLTGLGSVTMEDWVYGTTPSNPVPSSTTHDITNVTYMYKVSNADDSTYTSIKPTNVGTYMIKAVFAESINYYETIAYDEFKITAASLPEVTVDLSDKAYTGSPIAPTVAIVGLTKDTDYTVAYTNNTSVGTATITIIGKGNYTGTITKTFKIVAAALDASKVTVDLTDKTYTGSPITPTVTIAGLTQGTDYDVVYSNNKNGGTATITITGKGNYTGTITKTFKIVEKEITVIWGELDLEYTGNAVAPTAKASGAVNGEIITLNVITTPEQAIDAGTYTATVSIGSVSVGEVSNYVLTGDNLQTEFRILDLITDGSWDEVREVNGPQLMTGMTGVYWNENGEEKEVTETDYANWYDYENNEWANAKTKDGSYWVWVPRYAYQIKSELYNGGRGVSGEIAVEFLQGASNLNAEGEEISTSYPSVSGNAMSDFVVHPVFTDGTSNGFKNGEWDEDVPGFWIAKYEAGFQASTTDVSNPEKVLNESDIIKYSSKNYTVHNSSYTINAIDTNLSAKPKMSYPVFKPLTYSYNIISTGDAYTLSRILTEGTKDTNFYGLDAKKTDSHMLKNIEWGAVAYLTQSVYGRDGVEVTINSKNLANLNSKNIYAITGYGSTANDVTASSTGNITGVFDLSGGTAEYTATYIPVGSALSRYGSSFASISGTSSKYVTVYNFISDSETTNYNSYKSAGYGFGDGILETSFSGSGSNSWHADYSNFVFSSYPFFLRGGNYNISSTVGVFNFNDDTGNVSNNNGFRVCLFGSSEIRQAEVTGVEEAYEYTGSAITPTPTVTLDGKTLTAGTDYEVTYSNNTEVGIATVVITGKGEYTGTKRVEFNIVKNELAIPTVDGSYTYDGTEQTVRLVNGYNSDIVTISGNKVTNAGRHTVTVELTTAAAKNYKWEGKAENETSVSLTWIIAPKAVTIAWGELDLEYTGDPIAPTATASGAVNGETITINVTTTPEQAIEAGTYTATASIGSVSVGEVTNYILTGDNIDAEFVINLLDETAPIVTLTANDSVDKVSDLNAVVTDDGIIAKYEFYLNDELVSTNETSAAELTYDASTLFGENTAYVKVIDKAGNVGTSNTVTFWDYDVENATELRLFSDYVNGSNGKTANTFENKTVRLVDNIDLGATWDSNGNLISGELFTPIGASTDFSGTFDGQNYAISNLVINTSNSYVGLFGYTVGTIKNVGIESGYIKGTYSSYGATGAIAAGMEAPTMENCYNKATVVGSYSVGGLIGNLSAGDGTKVTSITNCYNEGDVITIKSGTYNKVFAGGLIGNSTKFFNIDMLVSNCYNTGSVTATASETNTYVGGIIGYSSSSTSSNGGGLDVEYCYNTGDIAGNALSSGSLYAGGLVGYSNYSIKNSYNAGNITISGSATINNAGGIVGGTAPYIASEISNCYNLGIITGTSTTAYRMGGIIGAKEGVTTGNVSSPQLTVNNVYNRGNIVSSGSSTANYCGGLIGDTYIYNGSAIGQIVFTNCYNSGTVSGKTYVGSLIGVKRGYMTLGTSSAKCYYLSGTTHYGYNILNQAGYSESVATFDGTMPTVLSIVGTGFVEDSSNVNNGYPILSWQ